LISFEVRADQFYGKEITNMAGKVSAKGKAKPGGKKAVGAKGKGKAAPAPSSGG
jgi:hypothetical protein